VGIIAELKFINVVLGSNEISWIAINVIIILIHPGVRHLRAA
jgi:hypothetical protein